MKVELIKDFPEIFLELQRRPHDAKFPVVAFREIGSITIAETEYQIVFELMKAKRIPFRVMSTLAVADSHPVGRGRLAAMHGTLQETSIEDAVENSLRPKRPAKGVEFEAGTGVVLDNADAIKLYIKAGGVLFEPGTLKGMMLERIRSRIPALRYVANHPDEASTIVELFKELGINHKAVDNTITITGESSVAAVALSGGSFNRSSQFLQKMGLSLC